MIRRFCRGFTLVIVLLSVSGCASVDFDQKKSVSYALDDSSSTSLAKRVAEALPVVESGQSAFYPMADGVDALAARFAIAEQAERTIDAQYYLWHNDPVGRAFIEVLLNAADRGVRVRLLIDDIETSGMDEMMLALHSHPNFEIRVFNPFASRASRYWDILLDFSRVNRRMHNKAFILDNEVVVVGGRNIADEYFGADNRASFDDMDVLAVGPVVREVSGMFDQYWNDRLSLPIDGVAKASAKLNYSLDQLRKELFHAQESFHGSEYQLALKAREQGYLHRHPDQFLVSDYELLFDPPSKAQNEKSDEREDIINSVERYMLQAEKEIYIVSPYFVLLPNGVKQFIEMRERGVDVIIVTNSLAANNHSSVHSGYMKSRKALLRAGIRIFELRPDAQVQGTEFVNNDYAISTLHTKVFVVDRRYYFIGSFNFDPRSAYLNTESGVVLDSPKLGEALVAEHAAMGMDQAYELYLNEKGKIRWKTMLNGKEEIYTMEPNTTVMKRLTTRLMGYLPIMKSL